MSHTIADSSAPLAIITGAAGHVGLACARRFHDHRLLITDLRAEAVEASARTLRSEGADVVAVAADITRPEDAVRLSQIAAQSRGLAVLIHAAGVAPPSSPETIYAVNLLGTINLLEAFEPSVTPGVAGVCVASMAGHRKLGHRFDRILLDPPPDPRILAGLIEAESPSTPKQRLAYAASKRGTILQVQRRAAAWARRGGRLLSVSPGVLGDTAMGAQRQASLSRNGEESSLAAHLGSCAQIAEVVRFAASTRASLMTGTDLLADGGYLAEADHQFDAERRERWHALEF
jgi:NAD(P)-dependent dehydrogenase (short-subunit alcohol dehydrogenase family)